MADQGWNTQDTNRVDPQDEVPIVRQCALAEVSRATIYAARAPRRVDADELELKRLIDEEYTRHPFYGSRKMVVFLKEAGHLVNRKRVQRLMREMGLGSMAPGPNTSRPSPSHKVYPYLLRGVPVLRPNQVWSTDITYLVSDRKIPFFDICPVFKQSINLTQPAFGKKPDRSAPDLP